MKIIEQLLGCLWILTLLIKQDNDKNKSTVLRKLGGQQMSHQICLKTVSYHIFCQKLLFNKENIQTFPLYSHIYTELFI